MRDLNKILDTDQSLRSILIDAILEYAGDEYEKSADYINLAKMSKIDLYQDLENIQGYFEGKDTYSKENIEEIQLILDHYNEYNK